MLRLPLLLGMLLSVLVSSVVFILSVLERVTVPTLFVRTFFSFFLLGIMGAILGYVLEIFVMPVAVDKKQDKIKEEIIEGFEPVSKELKDIGEDTDNLYVYENLQSELKKERKSQEKQKDTFKPISFPVYSLKDEKKDT